MTVGDALELGEAECDSGADARPLDEAHALARTLEDADREMAADDDAKAPLALGGALGALADEDALPLPLPEDFFLPPVASPGSR